VNRRVRSRTHGGVGGREGRPSLLPNYDWRDRKVKDIREGEFYLTRFASPQSTLIPLTPQDSVVVYRAKRPRRRAPRLSPMQQVLLFEVVHAG